MPQAEQYSPARDRVCHIRILGLFGIFDHEIPLASESRVTVIHGPNGVGKTIVLRMIREVFSGKSDVFKRVPFERFELSFESGDKIELYPDEAEKDFVKIRYKICIDSETHEGTYTPQYEEVSIRRVTSSLGQYWHYSGDGTWIDRRDGEILSVESLKDRVPFKVLEPLIREDDVIIAKIRDKCNVQFIGTDRLVGDTVEAREGLDPYFSHTAYQRHRRAFPMANHGANDGETERMAINKYSVDLTVRIENTLSEYGKLTEQLDRSLVKRLLVSKFARISPGEVLKRFKELDVKRRELTSLGLLTETEDVLDRSGDADVLRLVSASIDVFSLYVLDMQKKLALFDQLQEKVGILLDRTNQRFQFKKLTIDPAEGLVFLSDTGARLAVSDLSSGEQHEMILFYGLLFFATEGDLVLIDEPEISLHVEWQMQFLGDLKAALRLSHTHAIVATHAPAIAQEAGENLVPLGLRAR